MKTTQPTRHTKDAVQVRRVQTGDLAQAAEKSSATHSLAALQQMASQSTVVQKSAELQRMEEERRRSQVSRDAATPKANKTGLPDTIKSGIEHLSGLSMDHVKVHRNSARPATVQAHAYAQGSDIHLAPGQERHLPHEAWHVVQQAQGRVKPTMQAKGTAINDDEGLEKEADAMGAAASGAVQRVENSNAQSAQADMLQDSARSEMRSHTALVAPVVQRVRGGLEYTEDTSELKAYLAGGFVNNVAAHRSFNVGTGALTSFRVGHDTLGTNADLGNWTNGDYDVVTVSPTVRLTNDVRSAEWIAERHQNDVPADTMKDNLRTDINTIFSARKQLVAGVRASRHGAGEVGLAPGAPINTNAVGVAAFVYKPGANKGKAQITAQYTNEDTIRRINKLNASKFLTGTKVAEGEDVARISGTASSDLIQADNRGTTSFSSAEALLNSLIGSSNAIQQNPGVGDRLTARQVGIIKLMVINDALATTMIRYQDDVGQGEQKNLQRFFPKSRRDAYVRTIANAAVSPGEMIALRAEIKRTRGADAALVFAAADPGALRVDEAFNEMMADPTTDINDVNDLIKTRGQLAGTRTGVPNPARLLEVKTMVLGANGASLSAWIDRAAEAYTDSTLAGTDHNFHDPTKPNPNDPQGLDPIHHPPGGQVGKVLETSRGFTPTAGGGGAIYEMREREVGIDKSGLFNFGSLDAVNDAIDNIFNSVGDSP